METISTRRNTFLLTARHDFIENRKAILLGVGTIWAIYILFGALLGYNGRGGGHGQMAFCFFFAMAFSTIGASLAFSNMKTKEGRISTLMLPATAADKFLVRWIAFVPVLFGILAAGIYLCDFTRIFVCWLCDYPWLVNGAYMHVIGFYDWVVFQEHGAGFIVWFFLAAFFFGQSLYFFGAILWPKLSFIKTFVVCWVLETIAGFFLVFFGDDLLMMFYGRSLSEDVFFGFSAGVATVLTIGMYVLAYYRFKRSQVIYKLF